MATYILRVNLDIKGALKSDSSVRWKCAVASIKQFSFRENKLVIVSHLGRPSATPTGKPEGVDKKLSLKPFSKLIEKELKKPVKFFNDFDFIKIRKEIMASQPGSVFMLENIRFLPGETKNHFNLSKQLASLGDIFINDDFATAHRKNASNVGITEFLPHQMGPNLKKEITLLTKAIKDPKKPFVIVIGGAKISDKMGVIKNLEKISSYILLGGGTANNILKARGWNIGSSIYEEEMMETSELLAKNKKILTPVDLEQKEGKIMDIGPKTAELYSSILEKAGTVIWGGPMGVFEDKAFEKGSYVVARAIAKSHAFSIVGGGETTEIINRLGLGKKIDLLSTGGGAMLEFLSGKKLPAIAALEAANPKH